MTLPLPKFAVYYGTIRLDDGTTQTFTAAEVAALYGITGHPYESVPLSGLNPFGPGVDELTYIHLKPLANGIYYDAQETYNTNNEIQLGEDFDAHRGGKWAVPPPDEFNRKI